jgi:hypothetical protein
VRRPAPVGGVSVDVVAVDVGDMDARSTEAVLIIRSLGGLTGL